MNEKNIYFLNFEKYFLYVSFESQYSKVLLSLAIFYFEWNQW